MSRHSARAQAALARLPEVDPAIAALGLWCMYRDGAETTHTASDTIYLGPEFPLLRLSEQTGLLAHHILHVALRHSARRRGMGQRLGAAFQGKLFDLACDALVNEALLEGGHALPRPAVRAAELLLHLPGETRLKNVLAEWDSERLYAALSELSGNGNGSETEQYMTRQGFAPDLRDGEPGRADLEIWAGRLTEALRAGQRAGTGIGAVLAQFADLPGSATPWETLLRRMLNKALWQDARLSHRRPDRSWLARDALARQVGGPEPVFEPGRARDGARPRLVIGIDTSSSVPDMTLRLFAAEALSIVRRTGAEAHLLGFDTEVHTRVRFDRTRTLKALSMRRGGGTAMGPVMQEAQALDPSLLVVLTDLEATLPDPPPSRVLWVAQKEPQVRPPYGDLIVVDQGLSRG